MWESAASVRLKKHISWGELILIAVIVTSAMLNL